MLDIDSIRTRIITTAPTQFTPGPQTRQAAVAVVLRRAALDTEVLFIKRAEKKGDPWSGDMAFPGGHFDPVDEDLEAAAMRETMEEIGLDLGNADRLGPISQQRPNHAARDMLVAPYVFEIDGDPDFTINYEVDEVVWAPLGPMHRGENHDLEYWRERGLGSIPYNGFRLSARHFVWGLTYRMVQTFFETIDPGYRRIPE